MFTDFFPEADKFNLKSTLDSYGVAVLKNVFTQEECDYTRMKILDKIKQKHSISEPDEFEKLNPFQGGIIGDFGIPFIKEVLELKTDPRVVDAFKAIWNEEKLTTSFDSIFLSPPPEQMKQGEFFNEKNTWFHLDQSSEKRDFCCVQGFINLDDTERGDGCLSVLEKSHLFYNEFYDLFNVNTNGFDWFLLDQQVHVDWFKQKGCNWRTILAPKGSMVFWDSRLVHMGTRPRRNRPNPNWRVLVYTCYTPARLQTEEDTLLKRQVYKKSLRMTHWPFRVRYGSVEYGEENSLDDLTEWQKACFGV